MTRTARLAAGEPLDIDDDDLQQFAIAAAIGAGHDPRDVRRWSETDLIHFAHYTLTDG